MKSGIFEGESKTDFKVSRTFELVLHAIGRKYNLRNGGTRCNGSSLAELGNELTQRLEMLQKDGVFARRCQHRVEQSRQFRRFPVLRAVVDPILEDIDDAKADEREIGALHVFWRESLAQKRKKSRWCRKAAVGHQELVQKTRS